MLYKVLLVALLSGCGFSPLYKDNATDSCDLKIATFPDREGQILKNELLVLFPRSGSSSSNYYLDGKVVFAQKDIAIRKDATAKRQSVSVRVDFELYDNTAGKVVYKDHVTVDGGYNVLSSTDTAAVSMIASDKDVKISTLKQAAREIKLLIESYLANNKRT